jgi:predicted lipid-binding transport protein (Tim44 family)
MKIILAFGRFLMKKPFTQTRGLIFIVCLLLVLFWLGLESEVFARAGGGRSSGSRGYSSGGSSQRSPGAAPAPQQREYQQPRQQPQTPPASAGRSFLSGMAGGLVGGLLGGMLFRSLGFAGGSEAGGGGFGFGDILIILIILGVIYFLVKWFRSRQTMQMNAAGAGSLPYSFPLPSSAPTYVPPVPEERIEEPKGEGLRNIKAMDPYFSEGSFKDLAEDNFFKIQSAWTKRDIRGVSHLLNPEMLNTFQKDVDKLLSEKRMNRLENIAVREVEIVEAGQDRGEEFITVKFYANLLDYVVDEINNQIVSGSSTDPVKFMEYWTFSRNVGEKHWVLAGITQEEDFSRTRL